MSLRREFRSNETPATRNALRLACALLVLIVGETGVAQAIPKTVPPNRMTKIDHYTGWNDDCSFKPITVNAQSNPAHGAYSVRIANGRIPDNAQIGSSGACAGKPTKVLELYYKPDRGYHGPDSLVVNMSVGASAATMFTYEITVQ